MPHNLRPCAGQYNKEKILVSFEIKLAHRFCSNHIYKPNKFFKILMDMKYDQLRIRGATFTILFKRHVLSALQKEKIILTIT